MDHTDVWYGMGGHNCGKKTYKQYGIVWCHGMVQYGMVKYSLLWYGVVWYGMLSWYGISMVSWYGMIWYDIIVWYHAMVSWYGMGGHNGGN